MTLRHLGTGPSDRGAAGSSLQQGGGGKPPVGSSKVVGRRESEVHRDRGCRPPRGAGMLARPCRGRAGDGRVRQMRPRCARLAEITLWLEPMAPLFDSYEWCGLGVRGAVVHRGSVGDVPDLRRRRVENVCGRYSARCARGVGRHAIAVVGVRLAALGRGGGGMPPLRSGLARGYFRRAGLWLGRRGTRGGDESAALPCACGGSSKWLHGDAKRSSEYSPLNFMGLLTCDSP